MSQKDLLLLEDPVASEVKGQLETGLAIMRTRDPSGESIAITRVSGHRDEFKRPFVHAHTIFVPLDVYGWLEADFRHFLARFTTLPSEITSSTLSPIELSTDVQKKPPVEVADLDLIVRLLPSSEDLAKLISALLQSERTVLHLMCTPAETIELVGSLLRLVPQGANPIEVATFQPRIELAERYKLTALSTRSSTAFKVSAVELAHGLEAKPEIRPLAEAIRGRRLTEVLEWRQTIMDGYPAMHHPDLPGKAVRTKQREATQSQLKQVNSQPSRSLSEISKDPSLLKLLKKASRDVLSQADISGYPGNVMKEGSVSPQLPDEIITVPLKTSPVELFMNPAIEITGVIRLLHGSASGRPKVGESHKDIVAWLFHFDFEGELFRFVSSSGASGSFLIRLINELQPISQECSQCALLIIREYFDKFLNRLTYLRFPNPKPRLNTSRFESVEQFQQAVQRSHVLDALEEQVRRLGLEKERKDLEWVVNRVKGLRS